MLFQLVQIVYWLALATWFGGVLFVAIAAPIIFRTVCESNPILPTVLSVNLENQHGTLLAGSIVANLLNMLVRVSLVCAAALLLALAGQWFLLPRGVPAFARTALFVTAVAFSIYDWRVVGPRIDKFRRAYIEHADDPELANPAKEQFDHYHQESITVLMIVLFLLLGMVLFSADISRAIVFGK